MRPKFFVPIFILILIISLTSALPGRALPIQKIANPSYFYPPSFWAQLQGAAPVASLAVMNPDNGPGLSVDQTYVSTVKSAQASGLTVIGYVTSDYAKRPLATVRAEINKYFTWYGVNGIFIDEASNSCLKKNYYLALYRYIKLKNRNAKVVINPGTNTQECFMATADIVLNFEDTYANYVNWTPSAWVSKYSPDRFWHLVYGANQTEMTNAVALSKQRNAGWIYVTDDVLPNPWDTLPADPYWTNELNLVNQ